MPELGGPVGTDAVEPVAMAIGVRLWCMRARRLAQAIHLTGMSLPPWPNM